ncbi:MAG TPA: DUF1906 domain-containing protein [Streptosporangiaceae bacterium]
MRYEGYSLRVPVGWPVYRLGPGSTRCVRYDRHAVYLGTPGPNQQCPAQLIGQADTVSVAPPADVPSVRRQSAEVGGQAGAQAARQSGLPVTATYGQDPGVVRDIVRSVRSARTGSPVAVHQMAPAPAANSAAKKPGKATALRKARAQGKAAGSRTRAAAGAAATLPAVPPPADCTPAASPAPSASPSATGTPSAAASSAPACTPPAPASPAPDPPTKTPAPKSPAQKPPAHKSPAHKSPAHKPHPVKTPKRHKPAAHLTSAPSRPLPGFDTCTAPSLKAMRAWRRSYSVAAIYIGGQEMACGYGNLSASWVRSVRQMGWRLIPIYVGLQAPCNHFSREIKAKDAKSEGKAAANGAIADAKSFGIGRGAPLYFDMEAYKSSRKGCRDSVLSFLSQWTRRLHDRGYISGVYSSAASGAEDLGKATSVNGRTVAKPDSMWFALWNNKANLVGTPYLLGSWWNPNRRIKQYKGGHKVKVGGIKLDIDSDWVQGPVY